MKITTEYKMSVLSTLYPLLFATLAEGTDDRDVTADDVLDLFGMAIAAMIDNDSNLKTPRDRRLAIEAVGKLIEQRTKEFRDMHEQAGVSWLTVTIENAQSQTRQ